MAFYDILVQNLISCMLSAILTTKEESLGEFFKWGMVDQKLEEKKSFYKSNKNRSVYKNIQNIS